MTTKAARKKQEMKRAKKKKHAHVTEEMAERHAMEKRTHTEEIIAIIVLVAIVPLLVLGVLWWPSSGTGKTESGELELRDGTYEATYVDSQPAGGTESGAAVLLVGGESLLVTGSDLSGQAADTAQSFFEGRPGEDLEVTVEDGYITGWRPAASP